MPPSPHSASPAARTRSSSDCSAAPTLLIVDNCEHVLGDAADWVGRLLDAVAHVRILCTSQAPLDIAGSTPVRTGAARDRRRRRAVRRAVHHSAHEPAATADDDDVRVLCRALDGLPLAIELAAARTRTLSVEEITQRLDDRFVVLSDPTSRRPERRRALRSTIAWSYDLLFPDDQRGLWALATFAGGATLPAAEFVLAALGVPAPATIDVLGRLAAPLAADRRPERAPARGTGCSTASAPSPSTRCDEPESREVAHDAHARWFADAARRSTEGVRSSRQAEHLAFVRDERANIDAALTWAVEHVPPRALDDRHRVRMGVGRARRQPWGAAAA